MRLTILARCSGWAKVRKSRNGTWLLLVRVLRVTALALAVRACAVTMADEEEDDDDDEEEDEAAPLPLATAAEKACGPPCFSAISSMDMPLMVL